MITRTSRNVGAAGSCRSSFYPTSGSGKKRVGIVSRADDHCTEIARHRGVIIHAP